jgi:deazaflavin-dependent oxidoreductase (nitroreductase family)
MAFERNFLVELFWRWHPRIYRWSEGRIGGKMANLPVLLLETIGRKTGERRETALTYMPYSSAGGGPSGESFVVIASVLGEPKHPAWYLNLRANPKIAIQVKSRRIAVEAREAEGEEREQIWNEIIDLSPDYSQYRTKTDRRIPVVVLSRRSN